MPRPGPRPYECVRRAWHSDRHRPMRGSIIQQIFKVVCENHSSVTKKNKEWQEKLPTVVLKAEEIMYSKANSEPEYMDLGTLWDRVNDAIDTIIRKDETETGGLLPPCVEAALNLGCVPVRASRSQRHSNPRNYLSPRTEEPASSSSKVSSVHRSDQNASPWSPASGNTPNLQRVPLVSVSKSPVVPDINLPPTPLSLNKSFSPAHTHIAQPSNTTPSVGSVYPLYYGTDLQIKNSRLDCQTHQHHSDIIVGTPVYASLEKPSEIICPRLRWPSEANEIALNRTNHGGIEESVREKPNLECDLSLRLGLFSDSDSFHREKGSAHVSSAGSDPNFLKGDKVDVLSTSSRANDFCLFSAESANDPSRLHLPVYNLDGEGQSAQISSRKRKNVGKGQSFWH